MATIPQIAAVSPEEIVTAFWARLGIYGENGVGKTTFLASIPDDPEHKLLVLSADQENVKPLRGRKYTKVIKIVHWDQVAQVYAALRKGGHDYKILATDTVTRLQAMALSKVSGTPLPEPGQEAKYLLNPPKTAKGWGTWEDVGTLGAEYVRQFSTLPMHMIFLFQELTKEAKFEGQPYETSAALTPAGLRSVKESLEILGRLYVENVTEQTGEVTIDVGATSAQSWGIDPNVKQRRRLLLGSYESGNHKYFAKGPTHLFDGNISIVDPTWEKLSPAWS